MSQYRDSFVERLAAALGRGTGDRLKFLLSGSDFKLTLTSNDSIAFGITAHLIELHLNHLEQQQGSEEDSGEDSDDEATAAEGSVSDTTSGSSSSSSSSSSKRATSVAGSGWTALSCILWLDEQAGAMHSGINQLAASMEYLWQWAKTSGMESAIKLGGGAGERLFRSFLRQSTVADAGMGNTAYFNMDLHTLYHSLMRCPFWSAICDDAMFSVMWGANNVTIGLLNEKFNGKMAESFHQHGFQGDQQTMDKAIRESLAIPANLRRLSGARPSRTAKKNECRTLDVPSLVYEVWAEAKEMQLGSAETKLQHAAPPAGKGQGAMVIGNLLVAGVRKALIRRGGTPGKMDAAELAAALGAKLAAGDAIGLDAEDFSAGHTKVTYTVPASGAADAAATAAAAAAATGGSAGESEPGIHLVDHDLLGAPSVQAAVHSLFFAAKGSGPSFYSVQCEGANLAAAIDLEVRLLARKTYEELTASGKGSKALRYADKARAASVLSWYEAAGVQFSGAAAEWKRSTPKLEAYAAGIAAARTSDAVCVVEWLRRCCAEQQDTRVGNRSLAAAASVQLVPQLPGRHDVLFVAVAEAIGPVRSVLELGPLISALHGSGGLVGLGLFKRTCDSAVKGSTSAGVDGPRTVKAVCSSADGARIDHMRAALRRQQQQQQHLQQQQQGGGGGASSSSPAVEQRNGLLLQPAQSRRAAAAAAMRSVCEGDIERMWPLKRLLDAVLFVQPDLPGEGSGSAAGAGVMHGVLNNTEVAAGLVALPALAGGAKAADMFFGAGEQEH